MNPGSKVKTPWSLVRFEMSSTSGPIVPETAFSRLVFPVVRFLSSYFVLIRCIRRLCFDCFRPQPCTAVHRNQAHTSPKRATSASSRASSLLHLVQDARRDLRARVNQPALRKACWRLGFCRGRSLCGRGCVLLAELVDAAAGIHNFLLAGVERMAGRTHFDLQVLTDG